MRRNLIVFWILSLFVFSQYSYAETTWDGLYAGLNIGASENSHSKNCETDGSGCTAFFEHGHINGGAQIGYSKVFSNNFYISPELNFNTVKVHIKPIDDIDNLKLRYEINIGPKFGYIFNNAFSGYIGAGYSHVNAGVSGQSVDYDGYHLKLGGIYKWSKNLSLDIFYQTSRFGEEIIFDPNVSRNVEIDLDTLNSIRIGLNYSFN